jgi:hypothetical protein
MAAGIPGIGIGGLFYMLHALLLPVKGAWRAAHGHPVDWRVLMRQAAIAAGVLLGIALAAWVLSIWRPLEVRGSPGGAPEGVSGTMRFLGTVAIFMSAITLVFVLLSVQVARVVARKPR